MTPETPVVDKEAKLRELRWKSVLFAMKVLLAMAGILIGQYLLFKLLVYLQNTFGMMPTMIGFFIGSFIATSIAFGVMHYYTEKRKL